MPRFPTEEEKWEDGYIPEEAALNYRAAAESKKWKEIPSMDDREFRKKFERGPEPPERRRQRRRAAIKEMFKKQGSPKEHVARLSQGISVLVEDFHDSNQKEKALIKDQICRAAKERKIFSSEVEREAEFDEGGGAWAFVASFADSDLEKKLNSVGLTIDGMPLDGGATQSEPRQGTKFGRHSDYDRERGFACKVGGTVLGIGIGCFVSFLLIGLAVLLQNIFEPIKAFMTPYGKYPYEIGACVISAIAAVAGWKGTFKYSLQKERILGWIVMVALFLVSTYFLLRLFNVKLPFISPDANQG